MKKLLLGFVIISVFNISNAQDSSKITKDSLDLMIGQMIFTGVGNMNKLDKSEALFESIRNGEVGGLILFGKNINPNNPYENLKELLAYAQSQSETPLFISIDEEGGRVNRLSPALGFPQTVPAAYLGKLDNEDSTRFYAERTAATLYQLGINMNFAPSVDVNINPENPIIGKIGRSFSEDGYQVAKHAGIVIDAHEMFGIATVLKHFPGHGSSKTDSHLGLTDVSSTWRIEELTPYKALLDSGKVRAIMTAHIVNQVIDERKIPSTLSDKAVQGLLRDFLGYDGVVISDDMQMKAISAEYGQKEAIKMAINAGVDILLFSNYLDANNISSSTRIHQIIKGLINNGDVSVERIQQSYDRIIQLKKELGLF